MKNYILILISFLLTSFSAFADAISVANVTLTNDDTATVNVSLSNSSTNIVALQFNLTLPEGIEPLMENDKVVITPSNRIGGEYILRGSKVEDGSYLFVFMSQDRTAISGKSGVLFSFGITNVSAAEAQYTASLSTASVTDLNGKETSLNNTSFRITVQHLYNLTYFVDNELYKTVQYAVGATITPEAEPDSKEGYTFSGWSEIPETMPSQDVVVNGYFNTNQYQVTFISDGTIIQQTTQDYGSDIVAPADPTKEGYTFTGWNPEVDATVPAHDVTYTAQFDVNIYKLTYRVDDHFYKQFNVAYGATITPIADPAPKEGYTFSGWSEIPETMPAQDVVVNGYFNINQYQVTFISDGTIIQQTTQDYGSDIVAPADPTKEGYTFTSWNPEVDATVPAHDVTYTAQFDVNIYKLTYRVDDHFYKQFNVAYGATITPIADPTPKEGYTFSGWSEIPETMPAQDVVVNGYFNINQYQVTFISDGTIIQQTTQDYGSDIVAPADPTKEGYTFTSWNPEVDATVPAHDVTYTAQFDVNIYKLTYRVDDHFYKQFNVAYGATITPIADPAPKEGYTFSGWSEIPETMPAQDVVVNGYFNTNSYTLSYLVDGELYKEYDVEFGAAITPEDEPTQEGYTFSGWSEIPTTMPAHDVTVNGSFSPILVSSILLNETEINVYEGATFLLSASVIPENAANPILNWTSSDEKIATVVDGLVTGIRAGEVVITAESTDGSNVKALCIATVQEDDGLYKVVVDEDFEGIYTLDGRKVSAMQSGIYIVRMKDGSARIVSIK